MRPTYARSVSAVVLFDLDNTLVDRAEGFRIWARRFVSERALGPAEGAWLEAIDDDGLKPRAEFFAKIRARYAISESVEVLVTAYRHEYPRCIPALSEETRAALRELRAVGWKIGIVSNGSPSQAVKITAAGLEEFVDGWVISQVVGVRKPDAAIFRAAAEVCACSLEGGWMVGDSVGSDIAGAIAAGLSSVWISRGRAWTEPTFKPDAVAGSVGEAVTRIIGTGERSSLERHR